MIANLTDEEREQIDKLMKLESIWMRLSYKQRMNYYFKVENYTGFREWYSIYFMINDTVRTYIRWLDEDQERLSRRDYEHLLYLSDEIKWTIILPMSPYDYDYDFLKDHIDTLYPYFMDQINTTVWFRDQVTLISKADALDKIRSVMTEPVSKAFDDYIKNLSKPLEQLSYEQIEYLLSEIESVFGPTL